MLEAVFIFGGGLVVAGIIGALEGLDRTTEAANTAVNNYGMMVEAKTREVVTKEGDERVKEVRIDTNEKWTKATRKLQARHEVELAQASKAAAQAAVEELIAAGWRPTR